MKDAGRDELSDEMLEAVAGGEALPDTWSGQCPQCNSIYYICSGRSPKPTEGPVCRNCMEYSRGVHRCNVIPVYLN